MKIEMFKRLFHKHKFVLRRLLRKKRYIDDLFSEIPMVYKIKELWLYECFCGKTKEKWVSNNCFIKLG